ncbi:MAG: response regulator transcription factor [Archangiaceae bacterium]|nr:response regulator transcription factor [Archangiaceae bacterium]
MRVLVVDDEADVLSVLVRALERDGHTVTTAETLASARLAATAGTDLLLLDLGLPDGSGLTLCRELRAEGSTVPILMVTARSSVAARVEGLDSGADDFLTKPFAVAELRARVRALGRRGTMPRSLMLRTEASTLDFSARRALRDTAPVAVTAREWAILEFLANRVGRVVSRDDLLDGVWGDASESAAGSLEVLVGRLRKKLGADVVRTVRGEGYALGEVQAARG